MSNPLSEAPRAANLTSRSNSASLRHARSTSIVSREVAGETIVVPICKGVGDLDSVFTFNPVGRDLWRLLENGHSVEELASWVMSHYEVDPKQASDDVQRYLVELQEAGLIRTV